MDSGSGAIGIIIAALVVALFIGVAYVVVNQSVSPVSPAPVIPPPPASSPSILPPSESEPPPPSPQDRAGCEARGGQWGVFGLRGEAECNLPTPDAGKLCRKKADCASLCVTNDQAVPGSQAQGFCYGWTVIAGTCLNTVEDGKARDSICTD